MYPACAFLRWYFNGIGGGGDCGDGGGDCGDGGDGGDSGDGFDCVDRSDCCDGNDDGNGGDRRAIDDDNVHAINDDNGVMRLRYCKN
jgi:hypothetical protein